MKKRTKRVNIRSFQRELYKYLEDLPLIVTKRGKPFLKVTKIEREKT